MVNISDAVFRLCCLHRSLQLKHFLGPVFEAVAKPYRRTVFKELAQYGLRYDDLYCPLKDEVGKINRITRGREARGTHLGSPHHDNIIIVNTETLTWATGRSRGPAPPAA